MSCQYYQTDIEYITEKNTIDGVCKHNEKQICGICWWKGCLMKAEQAINHKCRNCKLDTKNFKEQIFKNNKNIVLQSNCSKYCVWFEWFENKRLEMAKNSNIKYIIKFSS